MSRSLFFLSVVMFLFFLTMSSCGVKAPPSLPRQEFSLKVEDLQSEWRDGDLYLSGYINGFEESEGVSDLIKGCRLYYAGYSSKAQPCERCPIDYHGFHEFGREVISRNRLSLKVPEKSIGQVSFFKVHLKGPKGVMGLPSNTVKIETAQE